MKKYILLISILSLTACNGLLKKTANITELTSKLNVQEESSIILNPNIMYGKSKVGKAHKINSNIISSPLITNGVIYSVNKAGVVTAYDMSSKRIKWKQNIAENSRDNIYFGGGIENSGNKLFITFGSRYLVVLNSEDGSEIVRKEFPDIIKIKPVLLSANLVLVQTVSDQLLAYDMQQAKVIWGHEGVSEFLSGSNFVHPVIYKDGVIAFYKNGQVTFITKKLGQGVWALNISSNMQDNLNYESASIAYQSIIHDDFMYMASNSGQLAKIDLRSGRMVWNVRAEDILSMSINGNNLFITNNARQIASIDINNGKVKWVANIAKNDKDSQKAANCFEAFVRQSGDSNSLNVLTAEGLLYSYMQEGNKLSNHPVIARVSNNLKFVTIRNGELYLFNDHSYLELAK